jgi:hypothetical protein
VECFSLAEKVLPLILDPLLSIDFFLTIPCCQVLGGREASGVRQWQCRFLCPPIGWQFRLTGNAFIFVSISMSIIVRTENLVRAEEMSVLSIRQQLDN